MAPATDDRGAKRIPASRPIGARQPCAFLVVDPYPDGVTHYLTSDGSLVHLQPMKIKLPLDPSVSEPRPLYVGGTADFLLRVSFALDHMQSITSTNGRIGPTSRSP